ncbi:MAG: type I-U CRISPR-associated helicase/endonuclease Cas3 [Bryobacterales bacterium]|nr:type I-U CRISPR-associated helicase/endonuclease Cas3 [Bryobacterales bacterium]
MTPSDFDRFYKAIHGYHPFPWQQRLLEQVAREGWPRSISLPTSSGKTSAIDVAVFHLALEAEKSALERKAALRMFFVIDRRVVVDEAGEHAAKLARRLLDHDDGVVRWVATQLLTFGGKYPLDVAILRGGMYLDNSWADEPNQPLVCVSTVDQVGSRLLFRGYQVSSGARPVHAGLVGNDSLLIVDEAHLSRAFVDTLLAVRNRQKNACRPARGIEVVPMSATLDADGPGIGLEEEDYAHPELRKRLEASKRAELRIPEKSFENEVVRAARELAALPEAFVIGVVLNTVASARAVFEELRKTKATEAILLTGRNRPYCAKRLWEKYKDRIAAKPGRESTERIFVVATQTVEVGANLDFDALVTEAAPLDCLRQRFGRLNRLGNRRQARAAIVLRPREDVVYGEATARTWELLSGLGSIDFGVQALEKELKGRDLSGVNTAGSRGPLVFDTFFEMWSRTNPSPWPDPDVAPFLHGAEALDTADVQVVWREDLHAEAAEEAWREAVELAPPISMEALPLPLPAVRRWLRGDPKAVVTDLEGVKGEEEERRRTSRLVLICRSQTEKRQAAAEDIRPGDVVIVPSGYGGCDEFGWNPESEKAVEDVGDAANNEMAARGMRRYRIRLDPYASHLDKEKGDELRRILGQLRNMRDPDGEVDAEEMERLTNLLPAFPGKARIDSKWRLATWPKGKPEPGLVATGTAPEENEEVSIGLEKKITLSAHIAGVVEHTRRYAVGCGLSEELVQDLVLAAALHDLGKWDDRFQAWLCGGSITRAMKEKEPLAKSDGRQTMAERREARELAGYPKGARHEAASVMLACASGALEKARDRDLVSYLIGTHHGHGRPLLPCWEEDGETTVLAEFEGTKLETGTGRELGRFDSGWAGRFALLNRKHGYWGLAYLETILRRADCMQSRKEQEGE